MKITSGKSTLFGHFFVKYFLITCVHICISLNTNDNTTILHTCLTSYWSCLRSTAGYLMIPLWFWVMGVKKAKTIASSWLHEKLNFSDKSNFNHFYDSHWYIKNGIHHKNLVKIMDMNYLKKKVYGKNQKKLRLSWTW